MSEKIIIAIITAVAAVVVALIVGMVAIAIAHGDGSEAQVVTAMISVLGMLVSASAGLIGHILGNRSPLQKLLPTSSQNGGQQ